LKFWNLKQISNDEIELRITGYIVSDGMAWLYEWFGEPYTAPNKFRDELQKYNGKNITIWIDSPGGDIIAGCAIYTAIMAFKGKKTVKIDGIAASAASVIAMAGDTVMMSPASLIMIHNPWTRITGDAYDLEKGIDALNACKEIIINAYEKKTKLPRDELSELMDAETWFTPQTAIENKFADGMLFEDEEERNFENIIAGAKLVFNSFDDSRMFACINKKTNNKFLTGGIYKTPTGEFYKPPYNFDEIKSSIINNYKKLYELKEKFKNFSY